MFGPITADEVRDYLRAYIEMEHGTIAAAADAWNLSRQHLSHIANGRANPPKWMLKEIGLSGTVATPEFRATAPEPAKPCSCKPGSCERAARECVDWIKRATNQQDKKG